MNKNYFCEKLLPLCGLVLGLAGNAGAAASMRVGKRSANRNGDRTQMGFRILSLLALVAVGVVPSYAITTYVVPPGLTVGDEFRYVFLAGNFAGSATAASTDINVYNAYVNTDANAGGSIIASLGIEDWMILGSTATVNVITNIGATPSTIGIYGLDGTLIADGTGTTGNGLFSGGLLSTLEYSTNGGQNSDYVFTGTNADGSTAAHPLGDANPEVGQGGFLNLFWTQVGTLPQGTSLELYGISPLLVVGPGGTVSEVPEPTTIGLMGLGAAFLLMARRRGPPFRCD